jgi:hypothetical protein
MPMCLTTKSFGLGLADEMMHFPRRPEIKKMLDTLRPQYAKRFRCIVADCEDVGCSGWDVTIDRATYQKYESVPAMRPRLKECFTILSESESRHARINLDPSNRCPFLAQDRMCTIHRDLGESYLSQTCTNYPRTSRRIDGLMEKPLMLSCPEAASLVLLEPELQPGYRKRTGKRGCERLLAIPALSTDPGMGCHALCVGNSRILPSGIEPTQGIRLHVSRVLGHQRPSHRSSRALSRRVLG